MVFMPPNEFSFTSLLPHFGHTPVFFMLIKVCKANYNLFPGQKSVLRWHGNTPIHVSSTDSVFPHREDFPSTRDGEGFTVGFRLEANTQAPCIALQLGGGVEPYAPFLKQHALLVKGLQQVRLKSCPKGFRCPALIAVFTHEIMSV